MNRVVFLSFIFLLSPFFSFISASNSIIIHDYEKRTDFSGVYSVLIQKGDNPGYKETDYDDSGWNIVSLPSSWNVYPFHHYSGICWYRIRIKFPDSLPGRALGINLGEIYDADETYFNGTLIGSCGSVTNSSGHAYDKYRIYEIPTELIKPGKNNVVAVRVRNYFPEESGMIDGQYFIERYDKLLINHYSIDYIKLFFVISFILIGANYFLNYSRKRKWNEYHVFSLFCFMVSVYFFLQTDIKYFLFDNFLILKKIEYLDLIALMPIFLYFFMLYFNQKTGIVQYFFYASSAVCFIIVLITGEPVVWNFININYFQYTWLIGIVTIFIILIKEFHKSAAKLIFFSFIVMIFSLIYDVLHLRNILELPALIPFGMLTAYGFLVFIICIAFILSNDFIQLLKEVEIKSFDLQIALKERDQAFEQIDFAYVEALQRLAVMAELRDTETSGHIKRVSLYVKLLAEKLELDKNFIEYVTYASPLHDAGKVGIPDSILFKNGPLNSSEWQIMKTHTTIGGKIFEGAQSAVLKFAREIALSHHEKWNGGGYPYGLKQFNIPLSGRLMAMADVYDALRSRRPYKQDIPHNKAIDIITNGDNRVKPEDFDPKILEIFIKYSNVFEEIYEKHTDLINN